MTERMPIHALRALHSYCVESACAKAETNPELANFLLIDRVGTSLTAFLANVERGVVTFQTMVGTDDEDEVRLRVLLEADDNERVGLCAPYVRCLGVDPVEHALIARAEAAAQGIEGARWTVSFDPDGHYVALEEPDDDGGHA